MTSSLPHSERAHTTPLKRDNSRVNQEATRTPGQGQPEQAPSESPPPESQDSSQHGSAPSGPDQHVAEHGDAERSRAEQPSASQVDTGQFGGEAASAAHFSGAQFTTDTVSADQFSAPGAPRFGTGEAATEARFPESGHQGGPGETTRPAFHSPGSTSGRRGVPAAAHPPSNPPYPTPAPASNLPMANQPQPNQQQANQPQANQPQPHQQQPMGQYAPSTPPYGQVPQGAQRPGGYAPTSQQPPVAHPGQFQSAASQGFAQQAPYSTGSQPPGGQRPPGQVPHDDSPMAHLRDAADAADQRHVTPAGWLVRGLALVAVSLVSGLLWLAIKPDDPATDSQAQTGPKTAHQFSRIRWEESTQSCRAVSNMKIQSFFAKQECEHLTRALYTTELPGGQRVLTSITTVLMPDENAARQLEKLITSDNTGNILDLVDEGRPGLEDSPKLGDAGYAAAMQNRLVVLGDSAYVDKKSPDGDPKLVEISKDALQLGWPQDKNQ